MVNYNIFELINISYEYIPEKPALNNISFKITPKEKVAFLGSNGSGKSTLQKILAGLIFGKGHFYAFGQEISSDIMRDKTFSASFRKKVGFLFQNFEAQLFCPNVLDEIMFGPLLIGKSFKDAETRALELLKLFDIITLKEAMPHHLSGGEKKKVALASILATNPEVLILDEPTNNLDPKSIKHLFNILEELNSVGKTIIIATHNLEIASNYATRTIILDDNHQIIADGKTKDILNNQQILIQANLI
ncbi:energy-coupling factor ABC transporter ATP-binding protein [Selenomonadales bacterium OttesenSCG-928-I06]|nr:energy-coupling factor ABC transporter ATP-binding protein [Selenomonadales bacterium OttesenSCG-928-I06]